MPFAVLSLSQVQSLTNLAVRVDDVDKFSSVQPRREPLEMTLRESSESRFGPTDDLLTSKRRQSCVQVCRLSDALHYSLAFLRMQDWQISLMYL